MDHLSLKVDHVDGFCLVRLCGRLDALSSTKLDSTLQTLLEKHKGKIALDFTNMEYLSSAGIRVILQLSKLAKKREGLIVIFGVHDDVMEIIKLAGFEKILHFSSCEKEALKTLMSI